MTINLLQSLRNNSPSAMEEIYRDHWETVFDAVYKRTGDEDLAQDITQEIFISLWENRASVQIEGTLAAYLCGAAKYKVINHFRSTALKGRHKEQLLLLWRDETIAAADSGLILGEFVKEVDTAMQLLPEKTRLVFLMSRKEGKSIKEIASELDVSVQTVKNQISTAIKILRKNLFYLPVLILLVA